MASPSVTYTFSNGAASDATQVNQNFTDVINALRDGTKDLTISAITAAGTALFNGSVALGDSSVDVLTVNASLGSSIPVSTNSSYDIGGATLGLRSVYFGGTSSFTTRIVGGATSTHSYTLPTTQGAAFSRLENNGSGVLSWSAASQNAGYGSKSATYNIALTDDHLDLDATSATFTVTLPTAIGNTGKTYTLKRVDNTLANNVIIATTSSQTIDSILTKHLYTQYETWIIRSDGANWKVVHHFSSTAWTTGLITFGATSAGTPPTKATTMIRDIFAWRREGNGFFWRFQYYHTSATGTAAGTNNYLITMPTGLTLETTIQIADTTQTVGDPGLGTELGTGSHKSTGDSTTSGKIHAFLYDSTHIGVWLDVGTGQWWGTNTATSSLKLTSAATLLVTLQGYALHASWEP